MADILEKQIEKISEYFIGMKKERSQIDGRGSHIITRIEVDFQPKNGSGAWKVFGSPANLPENEQRIRCVKRKSNDYVYFIFGITEDVTFLDLIKHAEEIVNFNKIIENKTALLRQKNEEMIKLFSELDYDELKTLTFKYKTKRKKKNEPVNETVQETTPTVETKEVTTKEVEENK